MLPLKDELRKIGSAGVLVPSLEARIVDDNGTDVLPGQGIPGELWMRESVCLEISTMSHRVNCALTYPQAARPS